MDDQLWHEVFKTALLQSFIHGRREISPVRVPSEPLFLFGIGPYSHLAVFVQNQRRLFTQLAQSVPRYRGHAFIRLLESVSPEMGSFEIVQPDMSTRHDSAEYQPCPTGRPLLRDRHFRAAPRRSQIAVRPMPG